MNKFSKLISNNGDETLKRRAAITISQTAEIAQQNILNSLKQKKASLELKVANLTDLAPDSSVSLRPGCEDWDAEKWAKELQEAKQDIYFLDVQIKIAQDTLDEFFKEVEDEKAGKKA